MTGYILTLWLLYPNSAPVPVWVPDYVTCTRARDDWERRVLAWHRRHRVTLPTYFSACLPVHPTDCDDPNENPITFLGDALRVHSLPGC